MSEAVERGPNYDWKHEAKHYEVELEKSRELTRTLDRALDNMSFELTQLRAENKELNLRIKQWESEDTHEAMDCYVKHRELDKLREELKESKAVIESLMKSESSLQAELAKHYDVPRLQIVIDENKIMREALEQIKNSDRNITGMGSQSGDTKTWYEYGRFGWIAREALAKLGEPKKEFDKSYYYADGTLRLCSCGKPKSSNSDICPSCGLCIR